MQCQETQYTWSDFTPDATPLQAFPYRSGMIYLLHTQNPAFYVRKYRLYFEERIKGCSTTKTQKQTKREGKMPSLLMWMCKSYSTVHCKLLQAKTLPHNTVLYRSLGRLLKTLLWCCAVSSNVWKGDERDPKRWVCLDNRANQLSPQKRALWEKTSKDAFSTSGPLAPG